MGAGLVVIRLAQLLLAIVQKGTHVPPRAEERIAQARGRHHRGRRQGARRPVSRQGTILQAV